MNKSKAQFSLRSTVVLTAAIAVWLWIFQDLTLVETAVFSGIALTTGLAGHAVYNLWLPWRVTVLATVLLILNVLFGAQVLLQSRMPWFESLAILLRIAVEPADLMLSTSSTRDRLFLLAITSATVVFTSAHSLRPCLPAAIITALGITTWYGCSVMIMMHGG